MNVLYRDSLVEITDQEIVFRRYYFPFCNARHVPLAEIEDVQVKVPTLASGKWRLWGTGDFRTWFPMDNARPRRDRIFIAALRKGSGRIGFTVEDSQKVAGILKEKGLLAGLPPS